MFRDLFDRHVESLRALVRRRLPDALRKKVGESDIIQDSYLVALKALPRFEPRGEGAFEAWLREIVARRIHEEIRRYAGTAKRNAALEVTGDRRPEPAGRLPTASQAAIGRETLDRIRRAMEDLPDAQREVVRLLHDEGLGLAEAADRVDRSPEAVRKLYSRALARLSEEVER